MTDEQYENYMILEGLDGWVFCDRGTNTTINLSQTPTRWAMRCNSHAVYLSVGKVRRSAQAAWRNTDKAGQWHKVQPSDIPDDIREKLMDYARSKNK